VENVLFWSGQPLGGSTDSALFEVCGFSDADIQSRRPAKNAGVRYPSLVVGFDIGEQVKRKPTILDLIQAASQLTPEERERLIRALAQPTLEPEHEITELEGLGKEVWNNIDAQDYINAERDSWER
jgi:hypothetical protein